MVGGAPAVDEVEQGLYHFRERHIDLETDNTHPLFVGIKGQIATESVCGTSQR
jgi:hypothetical protein